jgi:ankyrin repeat protein
LIQFGIVGAHVNQADVVLGWTPLHVTTDGYGVRILVEHGANVNQSDRDGRTPVHCMTYHFGHF